MKIVLYTTSIILFTAGCLLHLTKSILQHIDPQTEFYKTIRSQYEHYERFDQTKRHQQ